MSRNRVPFVLRSPSEKSMHQAREGSLVLSVAVPGADGPETGDVLGIGPRKGIELVETSIRYRQRRGPPAGRDSRGPYAALRLCQIAGQSSSAIVRLIQ